MQFTLNRRSTVPMYRQLAAELREQIVSGAMAEGYRLPPERELASRLEVNRTTVLQAYQQLKDEGLIASKVGKGTFVLPLQHIETARIPVVRHEPIDEEPKPSVVRPPTIPTDSPTTTLPRPSGRNAAIPSSTLPPARLIRRIFPTICCVQ